MRLLLVLVSRRAPVASTVVLGQAPTSTGTRVIATSLARSKTSRVRPDKRRLAMLPVMLLALTLPVAAASVKGVMGQMASTTKTAKAVLSSFDAAKADAVFARYARDGQAGEALYAGRGDAKSKDLHARFARFASIASAAAGQSKDASTFGRRFSAVAVECRSCHSVYRR